MRPIPVAFHIWFVEIHTYGIGLALTFWFGLRYTERRLRNAGYEWRWVTGMFLWVIVAAIVGARALHVLSNLSYYTGHPSHVFAIWQGGLSSFGGLLFAVPVAIVSQRRRCPSLSTMRFADIMAPVLMASWGLGRLLGPQLMVAGGGHATHQWFGMYYAGQVGKRLPVPIFQAIEDFAIFGALLLVERWLRGLAPSVEQQHADAVLAAFPASAAQADSTDAAVAAAAVATADASARVDGEDPQPHEKAGGPVAGTLPPAGIVLGVGMVLWGIERFLDEHLWLGEDGHLGSLLVQGAGILLVVAGIALLATRLGPLRAWRRGELVGTGPEEPAGQEPRTGPSAVETSGSIDATPPEGTAVVEDGSSVDVPLSGGRWRVRWDSVSNRSR